MDEFELFWLYSLTSMRVKISYFYHPWHSVYYLPNCMLPKLCLYTQRSISNVFLLIFVGWVFPAFAGTTLQLGDSTGSAGNTIQVPLQLFTSDVVSAAQIDLVTDPDVALIASVSGSGAGATHIVDSEPMDEEGKTRVVVYSISNDFLFTEVLIDIQLVLTSTVEVNDQSILVESVQLSDDGAGFVNSALVPNATFVGPDSSVVYKMGDSVSASGTAYGTATPVDRVEFLVDGWSVVSDTEAPYEMDFPLHYFGNITISARAFDMAGNWFESSSDTYMVDFPPSMADWLDIFFSPAEQLDPNIGALPADFDLDGNSTLLEYAMGLHPLRGDGPRESGFFQDPQTGAYQFGYLRPVGVSGVSYTFQVSDDLASWGTSASNPSMEIVPINNYWEEVRFSPLDLSEPREFGRVLIESEGP
jgi:hypothetical protein